MLPWFVLIHVTALIGLILLFLYPFAIYPVVIAWLTRSRRWRTGGAEGAEVPAGMLAVGVPAKPKRAVSAEEQARFARGVKSYVEKAAIYLEELG